LPHHACNRLFPIGQGRYLDLVDSVPIVDKASSTGAVSVNGFGAVDVVGDAAFAGMGDAGAARTIGRERAASHECERKETEAMGGHGDPPSSGKARTLAQGFSFQAASFG